MFKLFVFNETSNFLALRPFPFYRVFHWFRQVKFANRGSILGLSQFTLLPQLPQKMALNLKFDKIGLKIIILISI